MNQETQKKSAWKKYAIGGIILVLLIYAGFVFNKYQAYENELITVDGEWKIHHASVYQQMKQQGISVEKYGEIVTDTLVAKYGDNGAQSTVLFTGADVAIPPDILLKLTTIIEAGNNRIASISEKRNKVCANYRSDITTILGRINTLLLFNTFPSKPLDELCEPVSSAASKADFNSKELSDPQIFKN